MSNKFTLVASIVLALSSFDCLAQKKPCKVNLEAISGNYSGDCKGGQAHGTGTARGEDTYAGEFKKGLPDGEGRYIWKNGNFYIGEFKKGLRNGYGELIIKKGEFQDSIVSGYWKKDAYEGLFKDDYELGLIQGISRITITRIADSPSRVEVIIRQGGYPVQSLSGLKLLDAKGTETQISPQFIGYDNVSFPLTDAEVVFTAPGARSNEAVNCEANFSINQEGFWRVIIEAEFQ